MREIQNARGECAERVKHSLAEECARLVVAPPASIVFAAIRCLSHKQYVIVTL